MSVQANINKYQCSRLKGKVAVITASTTGIGLAIAERLGLEGAHVVISSRKQDHVDTALNQLKSLNISVDGLVCHVGSKEDRTRLLQKAAERNGGIDILVSNAAVNPSTGLLFDTTEEEWDKIFDVNVKSTFLLCKEALPYLSKRGGSIVTVGSIAAYKAIPAGLAAYSVSKTALLGLIKAMVPECSKKNIRVNNIAPGLIQTNFSRMLWSNPEMLTAVGSSHPMGRLGMPEECAGAVAFLVSDDASFVSGETIVVNGGGLSRL